jgi:hypothetical protein
MKKISQHICILTLCVIPALAMAQATHAQEHAERCAGIFSIFQNDNTISSDLKIKIDKGLAIFDDLYAKESGQKTEVAHTRMQTSITSEIQTRHHELEEEGILCSAWAENFLNQGDHYKYVPVFPKVIPLDIRQLYTPLSQHAFSPKHP